MVVMFQYLYKTVVRESLQKYTQKFSKHSLPLNLLEKTQVWACTSYKKQTSWSYNLESFETNKRRFKVRITQSGKDIIAKGLPLQELEVKHCFGNILSGELQEFSIGSTTVNLVLFGSDSKNKAPECFSKILPMICNPSPEPSPAGLVVKNA